MEIDENYKTLLYSKYFGMHVKAFKILGVPFADTQSVIYKVYSFICIFGLLFSFALEQTFELFRSEISTFNEVVLFQSAVTIACLKFLVFFKQRIPIRTILLKLQKKPFLPEIKSADDTENKLLEQCLTIVRIQTSAHWIAAGIALSLMALFVPLLATVKHKPLYNWKLPFGPFTLFNATYYPNYNIIYWYQCASFYVITAQFCASDTLLTSILVHASFQFRILQHRIRTAVSRRDINHEKGNFLNKTLVKLVEHHTAILDVINQIENILSVLLLWTFLGTLSWLSTYIYLASTATELSKAIPYLGSATFAIGQVFIVCYWGEQVIYESGMVGLAAYESYTPEIDLSYQKGLILIIRRSRDVAALTAGKFAVVNIPTLAWIIRTSYSAFLMVRRTTNDV